MYRNIIPASLLFSLLGFTPAHAEWEVYKFFELGATATDNFQFGSSDELVMSIKPSVELSFEGNRFDTDVVAAVEVYSFSERGDEITDPRLGLSTSGTLVDNLFYVDSSLDIGKILPGEEFLDLGADAETQARFIFNPFLARKVGRFADLYFGFGHKSLDNDFDGVVDYQFNSLSFSLGKNPKFGGFIWSFGGSFQEDKIADDKFDNASVYASLGQTINQTMYFELLGGAELNDYTENEDDEDDVSQLWEASLNWTPSERTSLKVGYGDRFFGSGPLFTLKHRVRNSTLTASWARDISNSDVSLGTITRFTGGTEPLTPTDGTVIETEDGATRRTLFVDETIRFGYKLAGRRSDLVIDALYSDQDELNGAETRDRLIGRIAFDRHLSPLTTVRLQYEHEVERENDDDRENENRLGVRLIYNFDRKERASFDEDAE